ncbi:CvpA family protein [Alteraurantiacibacter aquimixticola]|uniref:CvpA family protein n=1 Tax=Alteraurantiacibacter aquimixticola TaxID=2489173 RepID=A0A4V6UGA8_9SPHN|nr:CvpA family protein [Alteraurantiacibacter aquimixticola]TIX50073.1 CvpA family protein [Alteraurantiacibacter aquimixticola]
MNAFDIIVLIILGIAAIGGFLRGFVQEVLSLAAWGVAIAAIYFLHTDLTALIFQYIGTPVAASLLAFAFLLLIPYVAMRMIARRAGDGARNSLLGPIDRVLGFGFGAVKGMIIVVMAFSMLALGYDTAWGVAGRPAWMTTARTYPFVNASAEAMVKLIEERRAVLNGEG